MICKVSRILAPATAMLLALLSLALDAGRVARAQEAVQGPPVDVADISTNEPAADEEISMMETKYPDVQNAIIRFSNRDFEGARLLLEKAKEKHPELPPAMVLFGQLQARVNNQAAARASYEQAVRDEPNDPEAYVVFADTALQQRRVTDAGLLYEKAAQVSQVYDASEVRKRNFAIRAYLGIATVAEAREEWEPANKALREVLEIDKENAAALTRLGRVLFKEGGKDNETEAYNVFQQLYGLDNTKHARPEINMARLYQQGGRESNASKLIKLARERDPQGLATQLAAAQWALETGNMDVAREASQVALQIDPNSLQVRILEGLLARLDKDYTAAEEAFSKANMLAPANAIALNQLALALAEQDDEEKRKRAGEFAQLNSRMFSDMKTTAGREAAVTLGWVLFKSGNGFAAGQQVQRALSAGPVGADSAYYAAAILYDRKKADVAEKLLRNALDSAQGIFANREDAEALLSKITTGI